MLRSLLILAAAPLLAAQVGGNARPAGEPATFKTDTQLVIETVTVKDKSGKPITGLTANDFTLTEDAVQQTIKVFEFQQLATDPQPAPVPETLRVPAIPKLAHSQIAPEAPGALRFRDRRLLAMYFDLTAMPPPDQMRAFSAAKRFVRTQMSAADLVAIMVFGSGAVQVVQAFT